MVWSNIGELIFNMLVLVGTIRMSDRIVKEMMGLQILNFLLTADIGYMYSVFKEVLLMEKYRTLSEVSKETGLSTREIKYYIERRIIKPTKVERKGSKVYNLYSSADVIKIQQIALYRELGYSNDQVKTLVSDPNFEWKKALDSQIIELKRQKKHLENKIIAAEMMKCLYDIEKVQNFDISDFDNNLDDFASGILSPESENNTELSLLQIGENINSKFGLEDFKHLGELIIDSYEQLSKCYGQSPKSDLVQDVFNSIKKQFMPYFSSQFSKTDQTEKYLYLLSFEWLMTLGTDRILELILGKPGIIEFIKEMVEENIKREEINNG